MRVLMISDVYFPRVNGVSTSIETFRRDLPAFGCETHLIAPTYSGKDDAPDLPAVTRIPSRQLPLDPEDRMMRRQSIRHLTGQLKQEKFDLVHIQTPFVAHYAGLDLAQALGVPAVATYHTFFEEYLFHYLPLLPKSWMRGLARRYSRTQCNSLDALIVPSTAMAEVLADYGVTRPMQVLPTGIPLEKWQGGDGQAFRSKHGIPPERPTVAYVGRVAFEKNIDFLLHALDLARRSIPNLLLILAGEGPALAKLKQQVAAMGLNDNVRFFGYLDRNSDLLDCYRAADAFVFASRTETQGLVLLEAMALGVPLVSTAVMGTRDILDGCAAALVAKDDQQDFAACMVKLLTDHGLRRHLANQTQAAAQAWCSHTMAGRLVNFYRDVISARH